MFYLVYRHAKNVKIGLCLKEIESILGVDKFSLF